MLKKFRTSVVAMIPHRAAKNAIHTIGLKGNKKPHGSTSGFPRPLTILMLSIQTVEVKSAAEALAWLRIKGPVPKSTS